MRDWRVRTKLGAVLTIPAVAFLAVAGLLTNTAVHEAEALQQYTRQVHLSRQITALVHELQRERDRSAGVLAGVVANATPTAQDPAHIAATLAPDQGNVDRAALALREAARPLLSDPGVQRLYVQANTSLRELEQVRAGVRGGWLRQQAVFDSYTRGINSLLALMPSEAKVGRGGERLAQPVRAVNTLARVKELTDQFRGRLFVLALTGQMSQQDFQTLSDLKAQRQALLDQFQDGAPGDQLTAYDSMVHGQQVLNAEALAQRLVTDAAAGKLTVEAQQWWQASTTELELIRLVEVRMLGRSVNAADKGSAEQWRNTLTATAVIVFILIVALFTSWGIGRSMARSLRLLRESALDVAAHRLPQAIERLRTTPRGEPVIDVGAASIDTADEIGEVAEAFSAVHRSAVRLAVEQALMRRAVNMMFVNLARRSQTLVERQLQLLDRLESAETDPDQLSNLFRLDHLATRMRRNDENLLVLAGADTSRRWSEPVALSAVVLAAMAEIEQYQRIRHDVAEDIHVVGHAVADVVHLLAELLENATTFSPPDTTVTVSGWQMKSSGGAMIAIEDHGLGMSPASLAEANQQLATATSIDVATSERMGLVVVANLAARHRIKVELSASPRGVRAHISLPAQLLAPPPVHRATALFGPRTLAAGQSAGGAPRRISAAPATATAVIDEVKSAPSEPVIRVAGTPTPAGGVPVITVAGNAASVGRTVARTFGVGAGPAATAATAAIGPRGSTGPDPAATDAARPGAAPAADVRPLASPGAHRNPGTPPGPPGLSPRQGPATRGGGNGVSGTVGGGGNGTVGDGGNGAVRPVPARPDGPAPARPDGPAPARRSTPTRAEDVLAAASPDPSGESGWWSRTAPVTPGKPLIPVPREPVSAGTSTAGLPMRVPMAQLPGDGGAAQPPAAPPAKASHEPDPSHVSSTLSSFYGGVRRATAEEEVQAADR